MHCVLPDRYFRNATATRMLMRIAAQDGEVSRRAQRTEINLPCTLSQVGSTRLLSGIPCLQRYSKKGQCWSTCKTRRKLDSRGDRTGKPTCCCPQAWCTCRFPRKGTCS